MSHCDWYQATIAEAPQRVGEALLAELPGAHGFEAGRGRQNYHHSMLVLDSDGETLATILHGGPNGDPNAWASGDRAEGFATVLRRLWPDAHRVTRFDSAEDIHGHYPTIRDRCRALAAPSGVSGYEIAAHGDEKGSTDYLGAKTSRVQHRCYEKGKQMAALVADPASVPLDWVRLEVQWRPDKQARDVAASVSAGEVWGVSPWVQAIAREVIGTDPDRLRSRPKLLSDFDRCHAAMLRQYGPHLGNVLAKEGSPSAFLARLMVDLERVNGG
jgi:hypothetical protein